MTPARLPFLARVLSALIVGDDADVVRGDLEETYRHRLAEHGDSLRLRVSTTRDAAASAAHWWWTRARTRNAAPIDGGWMSTVALDLRQMLRALMRRPGYAGMVALTLGLGVGATTTIYSVVDAMLVRPLPYREADRLVVIGNTTPGQEWLEGRDGLNRLEETNVANFADLQRGVRGIVLAAAIERRQWMTFRTDVAPEILDVANVQEGFFQLLSVNPVMGRLPNTGDLERGPDGKSGAVISYAGWQKRFGGDPNVIGRESGALRVIGVLPRDFLQPAALVGTDVEFFVHLDPNDGRYSDRDRRRVKVLARLAPNASVASIRRDLNVAQSRLAAEQPEGNKLPDGRTLGIGVNSLRDATIGTGGRSVVLFLGAALLLLVLAGTNAANLLIVRGLERDGELSLRRALGAGRGRLAGNLIAESVALALAGGLLGLGMAVAGVAAFKKFGPQSLPRMGEVAVNMRIVGAGVALSVAVGVLVGLIPAIRSSGADLLTNLRASLTTFSPRGTRLRTTLASMQLALALILGVGASLLFRSFVYLRTERLGFDPRELATMTVAFKNDRPWETWDQVLGVAAAVPGITSVAAASSVPFETPQLSLSVGPSELPSNASIASVSTFAINPTYFATAKIPIRIGRPFESSDRPDSRRVAIVNERFARANFGDRNPIGRTLKVRDEPNGADIEIVGVVGDVVQARLEDGMLPAVYLPYTQVPSMMVLMASTRRAPEDIAQDLRRALSAAGLKTAPVLNVSSIATRIDRSLAAPRFQLLLVGAFAGTAVLLAAIGLYGTLAFTVRSRTREMGIRMAMGATQRQIFDLVLRQGFQVLAVGMTAGILGALGLTSLLRRILYRVSPLDPGAFLLALLVVVVAVFVAAIRPARRASKVDPIASIRT